MRTAAAKERNPTPRRPPGRPGPRPRRRVLGRKLASGGINPARRLASGSTGCKSQKALGMRAGVRRDRVRCAFHRWYGVGTGRYSRTDPLGLFRPNLYAYAVANPIAFIDPLGLREIIFTGCEAWFTDDDGNIIQTCSASSGVPGSGVDDQDRKYYGPIPAGEYTLNPREFSGGLRSILRSPGWGKWRAPLHPTDDTETHGRDGFFLHGDTRGQPGSLGCVDIADCDTWARDWAMERPDEPIPFYVYYTNEVCN